MAETLSTIGEPAAGRDDPTTTRSRILAAAAYLFRTRGYRATTTRAISEVVGILSGSLFHYFKSKDQMLFEVMHEAAASMCHRADNIVKAKASPLERFRALIRNHLQSLTSDETKVLIFEWRELNADARPIITALRRRYFLLWYRVLEDCRQLGLIRTDTHATHLIIHGALSWPATWFDASGSVTLEQYACTLEALILSGAPCNKLAAYSDAEL